MPTKFSANPSLTNSYYEVTKVNLKEQGDHGRAWGVQVLKGNLLACELFFFLTKAKKLKPSFFCRTYHVGR